MELRLTEWRRASAGPETAFPALNGLFLDDPRIQRALDRHPPGNRLRVSECRHGLVIEARQHVGVLQLGPIRVSIRPKMPTQELWAAVSYALGLDSITRLSPVELAMAGDFADLLALMTLQEAERLWRSGIQRGYRETSRWVSTLRGRPDVVALARHGPLTEAALPCRYHAFTADTLENQVVLAGLAIAGRMTSHLPLRAALRRAHQQWSTVCRGVSLDRAFLDVADRTRNRLTARYSAVHRLVRLMYERSGLDDEHAAGPDVLPGFLWNMASIFERFVARFLTENLQEYDVVTQENLHHLYRVVRSGPRLKAPRPRPDLVIRRKKDRETVGVCDTKYRDLWSTRLPREILYQMSVYALAWSNVGHRDVPAVVLYPAVEGAHPDMEVSLRPPGDTPRRIILRAIDWARAAREISGLADDRAKIAKSWVSGPWLA